MTKIITHTEMISKEKINLQKGMNYQVKKSYSIILMSTRKNSPYNDKIFDDGRIEYEGHDANKSKAYDKKVIDQPMNTIHGKLTENGKFYNAAQDYKLKRCNAIKVQVYRKIKPGIWVDMSFYSLIDGYIQYDGKRNVFKFMLEPIFDKSLINEPEYIDMIHNRYIPGDVQAEVYKRDKGMCQQVMENGKICGKKDNLHFDHIVHYSRGGSSKDARNIRLLCARHNLSRGNKFK
jgi:hypothetical protein